MFSINEFIHGLHYQDLPDKAVTMARHCLLDLVGVLAAGSQTQLSAIVREHVAHYFAAREGYGARILLDDRQASVVGVVLAGAATIDAFDAHDGHKLTKGHIGVAVLPSLLALTDNDKCRINGHQFLTALVLGYEIGSRAGIAQHRLSADYHASGSWNAIPCAALGARLLGLDVQQTREAFGIAEYHAPIGLMMRCIDYPTMVKDSSGWGAAAGVSAALLARDGFTGAPANIIENDDVRDIWNDLGQRWYILEQYVKPYPVCRWAQPAIDAALALQRKHRFTADEVCAVTVTSFHQAKRLSTRQPSTTEQAQYSLPYPVACALTHGRVATEEVTTLNDPAVLRISELIKLEENTEFNNRFPTERWAQIQVKLADGRELTSPPTTAHGDPEDPITATELSTKYYTLAEPVLGATCAQTLEAAITGLDDTKESVSAFMAALFKT